MMANGIRSPFCASVRSYLFALACETWSEFHRNFVDLKQWEQSDGSYLTYPFTKADQKKATKACNLIASEFTCTRDEMIRIASSPFLLEILAEEPPVALLSGESLTRSE